MRISLCVKSSSEEVFGLPNIKSAKKRVLVNQAKAMQNKAVKSAIKTDLKKFEAAVAEGNRSEAEGAYKVAVKAVDKAVGHGLLHKNNAARKKSSMTVKLNKLA
jgi:ribosomal protein S20